MFVLMIGTAGYAGVRGLLSSTAAANAPRSDYTKDDRKREAGADILVTPTALALSLIAVLLVVAVANPSRIKVTTGSNS
jgi:hypothetical protein